MLLQPGADRVEEAKDSFRTAIDIARNQSARMYELRATISLARIPAVQERREEARAILAEIYNWFTEGFDTHDLIEARKLAEELTPYHAEARH